MKVFALDRANLKQKKDKMSTDSYTNKYAVSGIYQITRLIQIITNGIAPIVILTTRGERREQRKNFNFLSNLS